MSDNEDMFARLASTGIIKLAEAEKRIAELEAEVERLRETIAELAKSGEVIASDYELAVKCEYGAHPANVWRIERDLSDVREFRAIVERFKGGKEGDDDE